MTYGGIDQRSRGGDKEKENDKEKERETGDLRRGCDVVEQVGIRGQ